MRSARACARLRHVKRLRGAVVIVESGKVALIERVNERGTYYVFPGGGVEPGETIRDAAIREAYEELGLSVRLGELLCVVHFTDEQHYFAAHTVAGAFGAGNGPEVSSPGAGSYRPVWLPLAELAQRPVYPARLAELIASNALSTAAKPVVFEEAD